MVDDKLKDRDQQQAARQPGQRGTAASQGAAGQAGSVGGGTAGATDTTDTHGAEHHAAGAHGKPATVDTSLPATRHELMDLHALARARRNGAALGSDAFRNAVEEIARIEVRIAAIDRAQDPPLV